jgi:hypothetical protein
MRPSYAAWTDELVPCLERSLASALTLKPNATKSRG